MMIALLWTLVVSLFAGAGDVDIVSADEDVNSDAGAGSSVTLIDTYPIEEELFVQGLEIDDNGRVLLSTGLYGDSRIGYLDVEEGTFDEVDRLDSEYFGEGVTVTPSGVMQLTWKEETLFVRDVESLEVVDTVSYEGEGWGLAYDEHADGVWMSDGSNTIKLRDLDTFDVLDEIETEYENINELEFVDGFLYANIWLSYDLIKIDVSQGEVVEVYDLEEIVYSIDMDEDKLAQMDTLNGIAHIEDDEFYLAGKNYPNLYRVRIE